MGGGLQGAGTGLLHKVAQGLAMPARQQGGLALREGSSLSIWVCIRTLTPGGQEV